MDFNRRSATQMALFLAYAIACAFVWWGNAELPLEFHDREMFADHERIAADPAFFFSAEKAQYNGRWLANAYQLVVYWIAGENAPPVYRFMALALHGLATLLLVRLAVLRGASALVAHGAGLWFLAAPSHYQVIHHISAVDYILCALFGLCALVRVTARRAWDIWVGLALLCALLSHQAGLFFAGLCWVEIYKRDWRKGSAAALALLGAGVALWISLPEDTSGGGAATAFSTLISWSYAWELIKSFVGLIGRQVAFAFSFPLPPNSAADILPALGAGILLGIAWLGYRRHAALPWALEALVLCIPFALLINEFLAGLTAGPIRYLYLSSGFAFVAATTLLARLGSRVLVLCVGLGLVVSLSSWPEARHLTQASAAWAAADGHEEEALALYLPLWESELLSPEYVEGAHENALVLAVGRAENFAVLLAKAQQRYPDNKRIGLVAASIEVIEDPAALARHAPGWLADPEAALVVGSVLYRLFRQHARAAEAGEMYAALMLAQAVSPRAHAAQALVEVRKVLAAHGKLDSIHADYIQSYGLVD